jgi:hypothetical protein
VLLHVQAKRYDQALEAGGNVGGGDWGTFRRLKVTTARWYREYPITEVALLLP